jgi:8-oxo-dGTP diphosphatase
MTSNPASPSPTAAVSALVWRDGQVLLVNRGRPPLAGAWALPGGRIEPGETAAAAVIREVREEIGIAIDQPEQIDTVEVAVADEAGMGEDRFSIAVFRARFAAGLPRAGDDAAEARWVGMAEIAGLPLTEGTRAMIERHGNAVHAA